jgi:hypothetical protein
MSANSTSNEPNAKTRIFVPLPETQAKMQPVSRASFANLIRRATTVTAPKSDPTAK